MHYIAATYYCRPCRIRYADDYESMIGCLVMLGRVLGGDVKGIIMAYFAKVI
jgi:hypothetical protein